MSETQVALDPLDIRRAEESVEVVISHTGSGIDPENIERIFEPLYSEKLSGTGLGLAICHEIINKHHGSISVESEAGADTSFAVCILFAGVGICASARPVVEEHWC